MKLLTVTNRYFLFSQSIFYLVAGLVLFYAISYNLDEELDEQLRSEKLHFAKTIEPLDSLNDTSLTFFNNLSVRNIPFGTTMETQLYDSMMYDAAQKEMIPNRLIRFQAQTKLANYVVVFRESKIETEDLFYSIFITLMFVFSLFCVILYLSNSYLNRKIWSPFLNTISQIKKLNINDPDVSLKFKGSRVEELNELNVSLQKMIERIKSDFLRMKEFSENAAHELQTPLSIIRSKLESLLQSEKLNNEDAHLIYQALENTVRLSKLNQSLLLLTKIENHQFEQKQHVLFSTVFDKYLSIFTETIEQKSLTIERNRPEEFVFDINPMLSDVLISNLLSNAIKHNVDRGYVRIFLEKEGFEVINTGEVPSCSTDLLFHRFKKGDQSPEHLGLGLALVKNIVETNGLEITYTYYEGNHTIRVKKR